MYEFAQWKKARVNIDYYIEFDGNFYSVPYQLIQELVDIRATISTVEIIHCGRRITSHKRNLGKRVYVTDEAHRPEKHRKFLEWTPERLVSWAASIGPNVAKLVQEVLTSKLHPEKGFRSCLGIIRLSKSYSAERMEAAATRAIDFRAISYTSFKSILDKGLDRVPFNPQDNSIPVLHDNILGSIYYKKDDNLC